MTLDDLEWSKRTFVEKSFYRAQQKNVNEDRLKLSVVKCTSMMLVSRNIIYVQIFAAVTRGGDVK